ncbi:MAG TPA: Rrf2 family transcriptional regulator [Egibacteraceae bacterium]
MRLEITRRTDLALRALRAMEGSPQPRKGADVAAEIGTTQAFLAQVVAPLVRAGWVVSDPGPRGGYRAAVPLTEVSVLDLIEAVEGPVVDGRCVLNDGPCPAPSEPCALHEAWSAARDALLDQLRATPVSAQEATPW